jgi:DNA-binding GntR family transcriptional regulator
VAIDDEKPTFSGNAIKQLRGEILSGAIRPGAKLHVRDLSSRLGISVSPVREALNQLTAHGLVQHSAQRGFTVPPADIDDLSDLTLARVGLNEIAVRDALTHGDAQWEENLLVAHHRLSRAERHGGDGPADWEILHRRFHEALIDGCRSERIKSYCNHLFDMADRYRIVSRLGSSGSARNVDAEHEAILSAALARDVAETVRLITEHLERTDALVRDALIRDA